VHFRAFNLGSRTLMLANIMAAARSGGNVVGKNSYEMPRGRTDHLDKAGFSMWPVLW